MAEKKWLKGVKFADLSYMDSLEIIDELELSLPMLLQYLIDRFASVIQEKALADDDGWRRVWVEVRLMLVEAKKRILKGV